MPRRATSERGEIGSENHGPWSVLQGVLPDTGLRGYRMRSAICLPVFELALSSSFPEVQPRAPAVYNMIRILVVDFCGDVLDKGETNSRGCKSNSTSIDVACVANFQRER